jgi:hypothetical protein
LRIFFFLFIVLMMVKWFALGLLRFMFMSTNAGFFRLWRGRRRMTLSTTTMPGGDLR